jgi:hypothetical protein
MSDVFEMEFRKEPGQPRITLTASVYQSVCYV